MTVEEIREALADWDEWSRLWCEEPDKTLTRKPPEWGRIVEAARAYADLLENGEVIEEWTIGSVVDELDPDDIAAQVGDTFIDFRTMSPVEQWRRIADLLARVVPVEDDA